MNNFYCVRLKKVRKEKKLTQKRLAELSGFSLYKIRQWEKCISYPNLFDGIALCCILDVELDYLRGINSIRKYPKYTSYDYNSCYLTFD